MYILCIPPSDETVSNSTNQYWILLGLRCWSVYDIDSACNGAYWKIVCIVDSGFPFSQYISSCYLVFLGIQPYQIFMKIDMACVECFLIW